MIGFTLIFLFSVSVKNRKQNRVSCSFYELHLFLYMSRIIYEFNQFFHLLTQEKLFSSKNRTETSVGKKMKIDMLPEVEKAHKVL